MPHDAFAAKAKYKVGKAVQVWYNPANPADAVLERRVSPSAIFWTVFAVLWFGSSLVVFVRVIT